MFKDKLMEALVCFIPFIDSDFAKLHVALGVMDWVLDSLMYCGQTSIVYSLWGTGLVFTVKGNTFSRRVAASLVTAFGTPENVFESKDALVSNVSDILNDTDQLQAMKQKARLFRTSSEMFDMSRLAKHVIKALKKFT